MNALAPTRSVNVPPPPRAGMSTVTLKGLWTHRSRFALTSLAVVLSVAFLTAILLLTSALRGTATQDVAAAHDGIDVVVRGAEIGTADLGPASLAINADVPLASVDALAEVDGIASWAAVSSGYARPLDANGLPVDVGAPFHAGENWILDPGLNAYDLAAGVPPITADQVVVEQSVADELGVGVTDQVRIVTSTGTHEFEITGIATYGGAGGDPTTSTVLFAPEPAAELMGTTELDRIVIAGEAGVATDELVAAVDDAVGTSTIEVVSGADHVTTLQNVIEDRTGFQSTFLLFFAVVALVAGTTIIYNTFLIIVQARTRELALLRSIGASRGQVLRSIVGEALVIGVLSSLMGLALGVLGARGLIALFDAIGLSFLSTSIEIAPATLVVPAAVGVVVTVLSAYVPALRAAGVAPVAALRDAAVDDSGESRLRSVSGAIMLIAAAVLAVVGFISSDGLIGVMATALGFVGAVTGGPLLTRLVSGSIGRLLERTGVTGRMARTNAARNPKRSASTSFSLTLGVALISLFTIIANSVNGGTASEVAASLDADYVVTTVATGPGSPAGAVPSVVADELAGIDGVETVAAVATTEAIIGGEGAIVGGVDLIPFTSTYDVGVSAGSLDNLGDGAIAVHASSGLTVGDEVPVRFPGAGDAALDVVAVFDRELPGAPAGPEFIVTDEVLAEVAPAALDSYVFVDVVAPGPATEDALRSITDGAGGLALYTEGEFISSLGSLIDTFRNFVYALLGVALVIALVGIANTTVMAVNERTREIGVLRAVGTTAGQVRSMVRNEALMLSTQGAVVGLLLGLAGASAMFQLLAGDEGLSLLVPWPTVAMIGVLGTVAGVAAAAWPAWRASRLDPLAAMSVD